MEFQSLDFQFLDSNKLLEILEYFVREALTFLVAVGDFFSHMESVNLGN